MRRGGGGHGRAVPPLAIYDMDKTITRRATYAAWLLFWARTRAPWRLLLAPLTLLAGAAYVLGLAGRARLKEFNQALLMGRAGEAAVAAAAAEFAARTLAGNIRAEALAAIAADRAAGARLVLATASYGFYAEAIGRALGLDDVVATRSRRQGGAILPRIDGANCYGADKCAMVDGWLAAHGLAGTPFRFYSDHVSDAPMFARAAEPVAVSPSPALRRMAAARGWRVCDWR